MSLKSSCSSTSFAVGAAALYVMRRLAATSGNVNVRPVTLPPGCARLRAQPSRTGSLPDRVTIGIVFVARSARALHASYERRLVRRLGPRRAADLRTGLALVGESGDVDAASRVLRPM